MVLYEVHRDRATVTITDSRGKKSGADPGINSGIFIFLYRKDRHIKGIDIFLAEVIQNL